MTELLGPALIGVPLILGLLGLWLPAGAGGRGVRRTAAGLGIGGAAVALLARERGPEAVVALIAAPGPVPGLAAVWPRYLERLVSR